MIAAGRGENQIVVVGNPTHRTPGPAEPCCRSKSRSSLVNHGRRNSSLNLNLNSGDRIPVCEYPVQLRVSTLRSRTREEGTQSPPPPRARSAFMVLSKGSTLTGPFHCPTSHTPRSRPETSSSHPRHPYSHLGDIVSKATSTSSQKYERPIRIRTLEGENEGGGAYTQLTL